MNDPLAPLLDLHGVAEGVADTRAAVDRLLNNRILRRKSAEVSAESSLRGAWAAAWLAGARYDLAQVRAGECAEDPVVQGALRAQAAIGSLADTWTKAPLQVLARLHVLAGADLVEDRTKLGRPRDERLVSERMTVLADVLGMTHAPAVVVAGIVHAEILSLDAFAPVSGIVALTAVRLTLVERGLDPKSLVVVEAGHREQWKQYEAALDSYRTGTPDGISDWLMHCCEATVLGAQDAIQICEAIVRG